ncbi:hypothetical protein EPN81_01500 [Patescibacteria group bacterium]|nr:MAG: hypothetical protein EPN81_01500 [Patescibacteria group bacterium]
MGLHYWTANARNIALGDVDATAWFVSAGSFYLMFILLLVVVTLNDRYDFLRTKQYFVRKD